MLKMLNALGLRAEMSANQEVTLRNQRKIRHIAPYELVTAMRASFLWQVQFSRRACEGAFARWVCHWDTASGHSFERISCHGC